MKYKITIVEDEPDLAENISEYLETSGYLINGVFSDAAECLEFLGDNQTDLVITDIKLKGEVDGTELCKAIKEISKHIKIIYITAYADLNTLNRVKDTTFDSYILKPFRLKSLSTAIFLALHKKIEVAQNSRIVNIRFKGKVIPIEDNNILYVESFGLYCKVTTSRQTYVVRGLLKDFTKELNPKKFVRIHKSYVINLEKISAINGKECLIGETRIPLRRGIHKSLLGLMKV